MHPFDRVVVADWSASGTPSPARPSADAIWIASVTLAGEEVTYHRTRTDAETALQALAAAPGKCLIGFDFPMGYPQGFAARLTGQNSPRALRAWLADHVQDGPDNRNNRFDVANAINHRLGGQGPFWGCPASVNLPHLSPRKTVDYAALGLAERRAVEQAVPRAQPVWKLYTTGSVGSQALMGLPVVHRLAAPVWPFDPMGRVTLAEVYPSLLAPEVAAMGGIKDAAQVRLLARALFRLSQSGQIAPLFALPHPAAVEEGWILGAGHEPLLKAALTWA